jgi:hypothetical protein
MDALSFTAVTTSSSQLIERDIVAFDAASLARMVPLSEDTTSFAIRDGQDRDDLLFDFEISVANTQTARGFRSRTGMVISMQINIRPFVAERVKASKSVWSNGRVHDKDVACAAMEKARRENAQRLVEGLVVAWTDVHRLQSGHIAMEQADVQCAGNAYTWPGYRGPYPLSHYVDAERWSRARESQQPVCRGLYWGMFFGKSMVDRILQSQLHRFTRKSETDIGAWSLRTACGGLLRCASQCCFDCSQHSTVPGCLHNQHVTQSVASQLVDIDRLSRSNQIFVEGHRE